MKIWLVTVGEPVPTDQENNRLLRTGVFARTLAENGHTVTWWTSTVDHFLKKQRFNNDAEVSLGENYKIIFMHTLLYKKNISWQRIYYHYQLAHRFPGLAELEEKPDAIVCAFPPIELSQAVLKYAKRHAIPVWLDVRDLWPDIFLEVTPKHWRWAAQLGMKHLENKTAQLFKDADGILGSSEDYLSWALSKAQRVRQAKDGVFHFGYSRPELDPAELSVIQKELEQFGLDLNKMICWFIGSFGKYTDIDTVIEAARGLQQKGILDIQFVICGDGENYGKWKQMAKGLPNVIFPGWISNRQIYYLMKTHHIGLATYKDQAPMGLPNKIFEYMSAGIPLICSLRGEAQTLLKSQDFGVIYQAGDVDSLLSVLMMLNADLALRLRMGQEAHRLYESFYSAERIYSVMGEHLAHHSNLTHPHKLNTVGIS